jgi:hypothetical protein
MKDVVNFEDTYTISITGEIISKPRKGGNNSVIKPKVMQPFNNGTGYLQVNLTNSDGIRKKYYVHRLVYETFAGPIPEGYEIDHIDCNKTNNAIENLQLLTRKENMKKCLLHNPHIIFNLKYQGNPEPNLTQL